jgi:hypothetical protein
VRLSPSWEAPDRGGPVLKPVGLRSAGAGGTPHPTARAGALAAGAARLKRLPAVLSVAGLAFLLIGLAVWAVAAQVASLLADLPKHKAEMRVKIAQFRKTDKPGPLGAVQEFVKEVETGGRTAEVSPGAGAVVRVEPEKPSLLAQLQPVVGRALGAVSVAVCRGHARSRPAPPPGGHT